MSDLENTSNLYQYIQDNIDEAIMRGDIFVVYQPVFRALTGKCCGFEALARWDDPLYGMIAPDVFLLPLEAAGTCWKLDAYVVNRVCRDLNDRRRQGHPIVPVSVNLSQTDFSACDTFAMVDSAVKHYDFGRHYLYIEISEDAVLHDADAVYDLLGQFQNAGFRVLLDHFGRQAAPVAVLDRFSFNAVKFDVSLMTDFNDRRKKLFAHSVNMFKALKIHTCATGVETAAQAAYLNEIGCETVQGFYFGRPLPFVEQFKRLLEKGFAFEDRVEAYAYLALGQIPFSEDEMFAVVRFDSREEDPIKALHYLFASKKLRDELNLLGYSDDLTMYDAILGNLQSALQSKALYAARKAMDSKEATSFFSEIDRRSFLFTTKCIAKFKDTGILWVTFEDVTHQNKQYRNTTYTHLLHSIASAYHTVYRVTSGHCLEVITSSIPGENAGDVIKTLPNPALYERVYWKDKARFLKASGFDYISEKLKASGHGYFTDLYRIKTENGDYVWHESMVIGVMGHGRTEYLYCLKLSAAADAADPREIGRLLLDEDEPCSWSDDAADLQADQPVRCLWRALVEQADLELFWKDREGLIRGASRYCYNRSHLSEKQVLGKTNQMIGVHTDVGLLQDDHDVLETGAVILRKPEQVITDGVLRDVFSTKFPVYQNGKIIGLMGYLFDAVQSDKPSNAVDAKLGVMTAAGFLNAFTWFESNYGITGGGYALAAVSVPVCRSMRKAYDDETVTALERKLMEIGKRDLGSAAAIAKLRDGTYAVLSRDTHLKTKVRRWCEDMRGITAVRSYNCAVKGFFATEDRKHVGSTIQLYAMAFLHLGQVDGTYHQITPEVLAIELSIFKQIFDYVQVIDVRRRKRVTFDKDGYVRDHGNCWEIFNGGERCQNCIAMKTMRTHKTEKAIAYMDEKFLLLRTIYVEVSGRPYAIGVATILDETLIEGIGGRETLAGRLQQLNREIYIDPLTGVHNRRYYDEQVSETTGAAVAFIDIDEFKTVNDTYGHHAGDVILKKVAAAIVDGLDDGADVMRYGGDEFVITFSQLANEDRLVRQLEAIESNVHDIRSREDGMAGARFSVSIGAAYGEGIIRNTILAADRELYRVKAKHKGTISVTHYQG